MCDHDPPRVSHEIIRKARKKHKCQECWQTIYPGDCYQYADYLYDDWVSYKICLKCLDLSIWIRQHSECGYLLGRLFQELVNSDYIAREYPDEKIKGDWISTHDDIEVVSQEPVIIRLKQNGQSHSSQ